MLYFLRNTVCFKDVVDVIKDGHEVHPDVVRQLEEAEDFSTIPNETFDILMSIFDWNVSSVGNTL